MALFLIERSEGDYDEYIGHVIEANDENQVREIAARAAADEGEGPWLDNKRSTVLLIGTSLVGAETRIILSDFKAG